MDGRERGVTPLMLNDLSSGRHAVTLESAGGTVQRSVDVKAGQTATLEASIYPGWLALFAPIELEIKTRDACCNSTNGIRLSCHRAGTSSRC